MFKKLLVSFILGIALFTSLTIGAKVKDEPTKDKPILVAKIEVNNQLSISDQQMGETSFINQVSVLKQVDTREKPQENVPLSVISVFWTMAFGLLIFVIRVTARPIK